jgi:hypothetical protein
MPTRPLCSVGATLSFHHCSYLFSPVESQIAAKVMKRSLISRISSALAFHPDRV